MTSILKQEYAPALDLENVTPHPLNPNKGDVGAIHTLIEANGFYGAIIIQKSTGHILAGNHRYLAAKQSGLATLPALIIDVDDTKAKEILVGDNRSSELSVRDNDVLTQILASIHNETESLLGTGYDGDDLDQLLASFAYPDATEWGDATANVSDAPPGFVQPLNPHNRPYEQTIIKIIQNNQYHQTIEPYAGIARASRLLLDLNQTNHAHLNDTADWPTLLHGHTPQNTNTQNTSPRITDDLNNPQTQLNKHRQKITISHMDAIKFIQQHNQNPNTHKTTTLLILDPPYNNTNTHNTLITKHTTAHWILFAPQNYTPPQTNQNLYTHHFTGPNQKEQAITNIPEQP